MPDRDAFLKTIVDNPTEDGPRLVFADWLEEQGDPRADFIRSMCERTGLGLGPATDSRRRVLTERIDALLETHGGAWRSELPRLTRVIWGPFENGMVETVRIPDVPTFLRHAEDIFAAAPIHKVWFDTMDTDHARVLADSPWLARLTLLKTVGSIGDPGVAALVQSPHIAAVRRLFVNGNSIGPVGAASIAESRRIKDLATLFLNNNRIGDDGAQALARSPNLAGITELYVAANEIREAGVAALRRRWGDRAFL